MWLLCKDILKAQMVGKSRKTNVSRHLGQEHFHPPFPLSLHARLWCTADSGQTLSSLVSQPSLLPSGDILDSFETQLRLALACCPPTHCGQATAPHCYVLSLLSILTPTGTKLAAAWLPTKLEGLRLGYLGTLRPQRVLWFPAGVLYRFTG